VTVSYDMTRSIYREHVDGRVHARYAWFTYPDWRRRLILFGLSTNQSWAVRAIDEEDLECLL
jgi:hypothetical protein